MMGFSVDTQKAQRTPLQDRGLEVSKYTLKRHIERRHPVRTITAALGDA